MGFSFLPSLLFYSFFVFLLLFDTSLAACKYKFIHNASELIEFSNDVNSGTNYEGYTVYLVNDIDFTDLSSQFNPIGCWDSDDNYIVFAGTFDGQGYVVSNLRISTSTTRSVGLFGASLGKTIIENVVIDSSCYFLNSCKDFDYVLVAGVIGYIWLDKGSSTVKNCVNLADTKYSGNAGQCLYTGGIVGDIDNLNNKYQSILENCVNYGQIYNTGAAGSHSSMGVSLEKSIRPKGIQRITYTTVSIPEQ